MIVPRQALRDALTADGWTVARSDDDGWLVDSPSGETAVEEGVWKSQSYVWITSAAFDSPEFGPGWPDAVVLAAARAAEAAAQGGE